MSGRWRTGGYPGRIPADPGHQRVDGGQARMAHPAAAHTQPGYPSPAIAVVPARSTAAEEQAIADRRESGPEDQPRSQHQQVGRGHLRLHHMLHCLSDQGAAHRDAQRV
jgi:hypothetical protein